MLLRRYHEVIKETVSNERELIESMKLSDLKEKAKELKLEFSDKPKAEELKELIFQKLGI